MTVWPNQCVTLTLSSDTVVCKVYLAVFVLIYIQLNFYFIFWRSWIPCSFPCFILCCIVCRAKTFTRIIREMVLYLLLLYYWLLTVAASHVYIVGVKSQSWVIMRQSLLHWHKDAQNVSSPRYCMYMHMYACILSGLFLSSNWIDNCVVLGSLLVHVCTFGSEVLRFAMPLTVPLSDTLQWLCSPPHCCA